MSKLEKNHNLIIIIIVRESLSTSQHVLHGRCGGCGGGGLSNARAKTSSIMEIVTALSEENIQTSRNQICICEFLTTQDWRMYAERRGGTGEELHANMNDRRPGVPPSARHSNTFPGNWTRTS